MRTHSKDSQGPGFPFHGLGQQHSSKEDTQKVLGLLQTGKNGGISVFTGTGNTLKGINKHVPFTVIIINIFN